VTGQLLVQGSPAVRRLLLRDLDALAARIPGVERQPDDGLYRPCDVARLFRVGVPAVTRWADAGFLPAVRTPGGTRRFPAGPVNERLRGGPC